MNDNKFEWNDSLVLEYVSNIILGKLGEHNHLEKFKASKQLSVGYEILSFICDYAGENNAVFKKISDGNFMPTKHYEWLSSGYTETYMKSQIKAKIHSVRRLNDGVVFSIGDWFTFRGASQPSKICEFVLTSDELQICASNALFPKVKLRKIQKVKEPIQPLFTTKDMENCFNAARVTLYPDCLNEKVFKYQSYSDYNG